MKCLYATALLLCIALVSCGQIGQMTGISGKKKKSKGKKELSGLDAYRAAGGRVSSPGGFSPSGGATGGSSSPTAGITPDADIRWAPEDPNVPIQGQELWKKPENKSWHVSYTEASKYSRQSGKPMLIWFTDSAHSPLCRRLSEEVFSKSDFDGWASQRVVRLRIDSKIPPRERNEDIGVRKAKYVEKLKRRYNVHGYPTVLLLSPRGAVIDSYRGYRKGNGGYYLAKIKQAVVIAEREYGAWREKLEKRGYRMWQSRDGQKTFAKLYRFRSGKVTLIDPDGKRGTTSFRRLCDADQSWIMQEKKRYEARKNR